MSGRNAVRVAVPVKLARLRVWVDKGRHWSGVDRLILWALAVEPSTAGELAKVARIPARLITEIILRMMRFGWVNLPPPRKALRSAPLRLVARSLRHSRHCRLSPGGLRAGYHSQWSRSRGAPMVCAT